MDTCLPACMLSHVQLFAIPWTAALQAPLSMAFSRQECWSGVPFPSPGDLPNPEVKPGSLALQADSLPSEPPGKLRGLIISPEAPATFLGAVVFPDMIPCTLSIVNSIWVWTYFSPH